MCGIFGVVSEKEINEDKFIKSYKLLKNRGPDHDSYWLSSNKKIGFGHTRLSIIDLSEKASQPMISKSSKFIIIFNGEIYNFLSLKNEIKKTIYFQENIKFFQTSSDTEVLLYYFEIYGIKETVKKLEGMYAIALYDLERKKIFLIRDKAGEKPIYYSQKEDEFVFSSDILAIKKFHINQTISTQSVNQFLDFGFISNESSIYNDVFKLMPNSILEFNIRNKSCKIFSYDEENFKNYNSNLNSPEENLLEILKKNLINYTQSDVPYGVYLSGGIDSSLIASILKKELDQSFEAYSVIFDDKRLSEEKNINTVCRNLNIKSNNYLLDKSNLLQTVNIISEAYTEPFADSSMIPTLFLAKKSKEKISVALSGDGADELFCGYNRHIAYDFLSKNKIFFNIFRLINHSMSKFLKYDFNSSFIERKIRSLNKLKYFNNDIYLYYLNILSNGKAKKYNYLLQKENHQDNINCLLDIDFKFYLHNCVLTKTDRANMYYGVECRSPYLNSEIINYARKLSNKDLISKGKGKTILRNILSKYIDKEIYTGSKKGFEPPVHMWLRKDLKEWAIENINLAKKEYPEIINESHLSLIDRFYKNQSINPESIWRISILSSWLNASQ